MGTVVGFEGVVAGWVLAPAEGDVAATGVVGAACVVAAARVVVAGEGAGLEAGTAELEAAAEVRGDLEPELAALLI